MLKCSQKSKNEFLWGVPDLWRPLQTPIILNPAFAPLLKSDGVLIVRDIV